MSMFRPTRRKRVATIAPAPLPPPPINLPPITHPPHAPPARRAVDAFGGPLPLPAGNPGIFPFGNDASSTPVLSQVAAADRPGADATNHGLDVPYHVTQYGGFSHDLSAPQDWSSYGGF